MPGIFSSLSRAASYVGSSLTKGATKGATVSSQYAKGLYTGAIGRGRVGGLSGAGITGYVHGAEVAQAAGQAGFTGMRYGARGYDTGAALGRKYNIKSNASAIHEGIGGAFGKTGRAAAYGGTAGAAWGMASDDTSVLGGAMMGALGGVGGARYGGAGYKAYKSVVGKDTFRSMGRSGAKMGSNVTKGEAMRHALTRVRRKASLDANRAFNSIGSTLSWRRP